MAIVVGTNLASMSAQRSLANSARDLAQSMERLATGKRINSAADDAAGFAIAERMTSQLLGLNQGIKNVADAQSMLAVAEGGLQSITDILQRARELEVQYLNDTNSDSDRAYLKEEATALLAEIDRIAKQTSFNGQDLLLQTTEKLVSLGGEEAIAIRLEESHQLSLMSSFSSDSFLQEFQVNTITDSDQGSYHEGDPATYGHTSGAFSDGGHILAWRSQTNDGYTLFAQIYDEHGQKLGQEIEIGNSNYSRSEPVVEVLLDDTFVVSWHSYLEDGSVTGIYAQKFSREGSSLGNAVRVNTTVQQAQRNPEIVGLGEHGYLITWASYHRHATTGNGDEIFGQFFNVDGTQRGAEFQINTDELRGQAEPKSAYLHGSNSIVVLYESSSSSQERFLAGQILDLDGQKIGTEFRIGEVGLSSTEIDLVALDEGGFFAVWEESVGYTSEFRVVGRKFDDKGLPSSELMSIGYGSFEQRFPAVEQLQNGNIVVAWSEKDDAQDDFDIVTKEINPYSLTMGRVLTAASYGAEDQSHADLKISADGSLLLSWISENQDGSGTGVFARRISIRSDLERIDQGLSNALRMEAQIGVLNSRLETSQASLFSLEESVSLSLSQIQDADYAKESAKLAKA
ncbi:MAG: flagellin, partial [Betaproteobacteria bacterium]